MNLSLLFLTLTALGFVFYQTRWNSVFVLHVFLWYIVFANSFPSLLAYIARFVTGRYIPLMTGIWNISSLIYGITFVYFSNDLIEPSLILHDFKNQVPILS
jgi:hypothetical protein